MILEPHGKSGRERREYDDRAPQANPQPPRSPAAQENGDSRVTMSSVGPAWNCQKSSQSRMLIRGVVEQLPGTTRIGALNEVEQNLHTVRVTQPRTGIQTAGPAVGVNVSGFDRAARQPSPDHAARTLLCKGAAPPRQRHHNRIGPHLRQRRPPTEGKTPTEQSRTNQNRRAATHPASRNTELLRSTSDDRAATPLERPPPRPSASIGTGTPPPPPKKKPKNT
ncbi:hypothetical protein RHCRD62_70224 [Rhodococcus sp. RD6.2]|nr:hypothetical protein RHCRD62_70224 [Rhodococcus sp. RD6.2]